MSELIHKNENCYFRWHLLAGVSALVLLGYVADTSTANAEDGDRHSVWIELGGQLNRLQTGQEPYAPPFAALIPSNVAVPNQIQKSTLYGFDESAALTLEPQGSDWSFSASLRYGRSSSAKQAHQTSSPAGFITTFVGHSRFYGVYHQHSGHGSQAPVAARFSNAVAKQNESHTVLDFQAGKDVGMGLFGRHASSTLNVGVRFAQFTSKSRVALRADPDWHFYAHPPQITSGYYTYYGYIFSQYRKHSRVDQLFHVFSGSLLASRSFNGLGPSVSWNSSETLTGNSERGALQFDWGVNAALLFGRQKVKINHQTTGRYHSSSARYPADLPVTYQRAPAGQARSRSVIVPNVGAFAGLSVRYPNVKFGLGYKADFFFGAMDGGIDVRRTEDVGFHGPYASVSIGLGG